MQKSNIMLIIKYCFINIKFQNVKNNFFVLNKYQNVTHVSTCIFRGLFKNIVFRSVALVTKKLWAILDFFFTDRTFFPPCCIKIQMSHILSINRYLYPLICARCILRKIKRGKTLRNSFF